MLYYQSMKDTPKEERPYEKCLESGSESLTDTELLAVILRTGSKNVNCMTLARQILDLSHDNEGILGLCHLSIPELMSLEGVGQVKAIQIKCVAELSRRIAKRSAIKKVTLTSPKAIADYYMEDLRHKKQEELYLVMFNTKNQLLHDTLLSKGTVNSSVLSPREVYIEAMKYFAVYIVLLHNHPSGDPAPSRNDILITKRVKEAGVILGIDLIDHIIIGDQSYISLKERGII